jgi:hypothetical protein
MVTTALPQKVPLFCPKRRLEKWAFGQSVVAIDIVRVSPSRLNALAFQTAQTLISPASQVSHS